MGERLNFLRPLSLAVELTLSQPRGFAGLQCGVGLECSIPIVLYYTYTQYGAPEIWLGPSVAFTMQGTLDVVCRAGHPICRAWDLANASLEQGK